MVEQRGNAAAISAVIVNYNAGTLLRGCVDSLLACPLDVEIIVVDNASHDGSLEAIAELPRIRIIRNPTNLGFAAACNVGMRAASSSYSLFLNPDCFFQPGAIATLVGALQSDARVGMVGGLLINSDGSEQGGGRRAVPTPWRSFVRAFGLHRFADRWPKLFYDFHLHKQPLPKCAMAVEAISGACMLVKREAVEDVGLWDEGYFLHCEDLDWCMRFRQKDWTILFVPDARIYHALGACSKSRPVFVEWHKHRGMVRFYHKFFKHQYPGPLMWLVMLGVWMRFAALAGLRTTQRWVRGKRRMPGSVETGLPHPSGACSDTFSNDDLSEARSCVGVIGASSMIGKALLPKLVGFGCPVHAFSRNVHAGELGVSWHQLPSTREAVRHSELPRIKAWICLAPIDVLIEQLDMIEACGARRVVALSSTSRFTKGDSSDTDEQALVSHLIASEERLAAWAESRDIQWVVLRPTLVYGFGLDRNISEIARFIRRFGFFPVFGDAHGMRQPVHAVDVADACFASLVHAEAKNRAYNISGAERLTYREMIARLFVALGRKPRLVEVPLWVFALAVSGLKILPRFRKWSPAMAERMNQDMVFGYEEAARDLGFNPQPFVLDKKDLPG